MVSDEVKVRIVDNKRKGGQSDVADVILLDSTGPVSVSLWESAANELMKVWQEHRRLWPQVDVAPKPIIRLENIRVSAKGKSEWHGKVLTSVKVIGNVPAVNNRPGTIISLLNEASSPYMNAIPFQIPPPTAVLINFASLHRQAWPFLVSLMGVLSEVGEEDVNAQGNPVRDFKLIDEAGNYVPCLASGFNAQNAAVADGMEAILYFVVAKDSYSEDGFTINVFKDSYLKVLGPHLGGTLARTDVSKP